MCACFEEKNVTRNDKKFFKNQILEENAFLTLDDLSKLLKVSKRTLYGWIYTGKLKSLKIGGLIRFDPGYIEGWISDQQTGDPD